MGNSPTLRVPASTRKRIERHKRPGESQADVVRRALDALESESVALTVEANGLQTRTTLSPGDYTA